MDPFGARLDRSRGALGIDTQDRPAASAGSSIASQRDPTQLACQDRDHRFLEIAQSELGTPAVKPVTLVVLVAATLATSAEAQIFRWLAFGDSITAATAISSTQYYLDKYDNDDSSSSWSSSSSYDSSDYSSSLEDEYSWLVHSHTEEGEEENEDEEDGSCDSDHSAEASTDNDSSTGEGDDYDGQGEASESSLARVDFNFVLEPMSSSCDFMYSSARKRRVQFGKTYVHEHGVVLGDRPDVECPIQLDWCSSSKVAVYDSKKYGYRSYFSTVRRLSARQRRELISRVNDIDYENVCLLELQEKIRHNRNQQPKDAKAKDICRWGSCSSTSLESAAPTKGICVNSTSLSEVMMIKTRRINVVLPPTPCKRRASCESYTEAVVAAAAATTGANHDD